MTSDLHISDGYKPLCELSESEGACEFAPDMDCSPGGKDDVSAGPFGFKTLPRPPNICAPGACCCDEFVGGADLFTKKSVGFASVSFTFMTPPCPTTIC